MILFIEKVAFNSHALIEHDHGDHGHGHEHSHGNKEAEKSKVEMDDREGKEANCKIIYFLIFF